MTGQRFGNLTVLWPAGRKAVGIKQNPILTWACQCDCGNIHLSQRGHLTRGYGKSCGCMTKKYISENSKQMWAKKLPISNVKTCSRCKRSLSLNEYAKSTRNKNRFGVTSTCKRCNKEARIKRGRKYQRKMTLKHRLNMSWENYVDLFNRTNGKCSTCQKKLILLGDNDTKNTNAHVDHNHETGKIRGILCPKCNAAIGLFDENIVTLQNTIKYLLAHQGENK